jgi:hypothetical protein
MLGLEPGTPGECEAFARVQATLPTLFRDVFPNPLAPRTVVVLPSYSMDQDVLARIPGVHHYEERMLGMLMLLRMPRTRVIYLTSEPIDECIIDYYLHLLQGIPSAHARARLCLLSCYDGSARPLTDKILCRPRLMARLREAIGNPALAHIAPYTVTALERTLSVRLGVPLYGCDPALQHLGTKSGGRRLFREAGVAIPDGAEDLRDERDVAEAVAGLHARNPGLRRVVVKLNEGFSGEGNALLRLDGAPADGVARWTLDVLPVSLAYEARDMTWPAFRDKIRTMGAIVECFIEGEQKRSPSVQIRIDPLGGIAQVSTHDQVLGGPGGQIFQGCRFPADNAYRLQVQAEAMKAALRLREAGVVGRFGIDFISVPGEDGGWRNYAIEINLRKGGTTHPFLMLQFLTGGAYRADTGLLQTPAGQPRYYFASDNLEAAHYRGLTPDDLVEIAVQHGLHYDGTVHEGVVFHLIGALSEFGKLGVVCVGATPERADELYSQTVGILDIAQLEPGGVEPWRRRGSGGVW